MNKIKNNLFIYDEFKILSKLDYCSLVEYKTIYGKTNNAIILNDIYRIICNLDSNCYLDSDAWMLHLQGLLYEENNKFNSLKTFIKSNRKLSIELDGEYRLNDFEIIIDFPYKISIDVKYHDSGNLEFLNPTYELPKDLEEIVSGVLKETTKESRMDTLYHEIFKRKKSNLILYNIAPISSVA